jgi:hypothetical protein
MRNASIYQLQELILGLLLVVKNVASDINHLDHGSFLVVEPNEICDLKLYILGFCLLDNFINLDSNL